MVPVRVMAAAAAGLRSQPDGEDIDTVVLACTHFPLVEAELGEALGRVDFVDGAQGIARRIVHLTHGQPLARSIPDRALFTGAEEGNGGLLPALRRHGLERAEPF